MHNARCERMKLSYVIRFVSFSYYKFTLLSSSTSCGRPAMVLLPLPRNQRSSNFEMFRFSLSVGYPQILRFEILSSFRFPKSDFCHTGEGRKKLSLSSIKRDRWIDAKSGGEIIALLSLSLPRSLPLSLSFLHVFHPEAGTKTLSGQYSGVSNKNIVFLFLNK